MYPAARLSEAQRLRIAGAVHQLRCAERLSLRLVQEQLAGDGSVPDARNSGRFSWWFETKTTVGVYNQEGHGRRQIRLHSRRLGDAGSRLFVLTPDPQRPKWFDELDGIKEKLRPRILWLSFHDLAEAMNRLLPLSELVALYEADGLLSIDDTVIVAARRAWPEYQRFGAYICQPERSFRAGLTHFGFYADGAIQPLIPLIRHHYTAVLFTRGEADARRANGQTELGKLIDMQLNNAIRAACDSHDG